MHNRAARILFLVPLLLVFFSHSSSSNQEQPKSSPAQAPPGGARAGVTAAPSKPVLPPPGAQKPDRLLQAGHTAWVRALAFSLDRRWLASGGDDKVIVIWDTATALEQRRLLGHSAPLTQLAFSPDGKRLASADQRGGVKTWDYAAGAAVHSFLLHGMVRNLAYSPDGQLWAASVDPQKEGVNSRIEIHDAATGKLVRAIPTDWAGVMAMTIAPEGLLVASGSNGEDDPEGSVHIWNLASGQLVKSYSIIASAISPDGRSAASLDFSKQVKVVVSDLATGQQKQSIALRNPGFVFFSPDGQEIAVTQGDVSELKLWSVATGKEIETLPADNSYGLTAVAFTADSKLVAAAPYTGNSIKTWDLAAVREVQTFPGQTAVQGIAISPDGRLLVAGSQLGLNVWDLATGKRIATPSHGPVNCVVFSPDGRWLATNTGKQFPGETLEVWDTKSWTRAADFTFGKGGSPVFSIAFAGPHPALTQVGPFTRSWAFTAGGETRTVWSGMAPLAIGPDEKLLVTQPGPSGTLDIWDMTSGKKLQTLPAHKLSVATLSFSRDGRWLLTGGWETPLSGSYIAVPSPVAGFGIKLWDVATWKEHLSISYKRYGASVAVFSPDGHRFAVEKDWDLIEVFDVDGGASIGTLTAVDPRSHNRPFSTGNLIFSPDGTWLFQAAQNGVRAWKLSRLAK